MKIAIVGAGLSGLSCAWELKKNGITPVIFEKSGHLGQQSDLSTIWLNVMSKTLKDPVLYLYKEYGLNLNPLVALEEIAFLSQNESTVISGRQGYIFKRGKEDYSVDSQLAALCCPEVTYDTYINALNIKNRFDHVVVANGDKKTAENLGIWTEKIMSCIRYATVLGSFNVNAINIWNNHKDIDNTFAYVVPYDPKAATLALAVNGVTIGELDSYWKEFPYWEGANYYIYKTVDIEQHCGYVHSCQIDNLYFTGNAGGFVQDLLGAGAFYSIESGILAARAIINGLDYNKLVEPLKNEMEKLTNVNNQKWIPRPSLFHQDPRRY